jgi:hypothetical protein
MLYRCSVLLDSANVSNRSILSMYVSTCTSAGDETASHAQIWINRVRLSSKGEAVAKSATSCNTAGEQRAGARERPEPDLRLRAKYRLQAESGKSTENFCTVCRLFYLTTSRWLQTLAGKLGLKECGARAENRAYLQVKKPLIRQGQRNRARRPGLAIYVPYSSG